MSVTILTQNNGGYTNSGGSTARVGSWTQNGGPGGYDPGTGGSTNFYFIAAGTGSNNATWNFTGLTAGHTYQLAMAWLEYSNRANNTPWSILDSNGSTVLSSGTVNQKNAPAADYTENDGQGDTAVPFQKLGSTVSPSGTSLTVEITDNANGVVIANAVLLQDTTPAGGPFPFFTDQSLSGGF